MLLAFVNVTLLIPVLAIVAEERGGTVAAGLATASFFVPAVLTHAVTPRLLETLSTRGALTGSLALLGGPCLVQALAPESVSLLLGSTVVRGIGFGLATVAAGALVAAVAPVERRGAALGLAGMMAGIPPVVAPALGVLILERRGPAPALVVAGVAALLAAAACSLLTARHLSTPERGKLLAPALAAWVVLLWFAIVSVVRGAVVTFAPITIDGDGLASAASFLLCFGTAAYLGRWLAGRAADAIGAQRLLVPAAIISIGGLVCLTFASGPASVVASGSLVGAGNGLLMTLSQLELLDHDDGSGPTVPMALWNISLDLGFAVGGVALGAVAVALGYEPAYWLLPALMVVVIGLMVHAKRDAAATSLTG